MGRARGCRDRACAPRPPAQAKTQPRAKARIIGLLPLGYLRQSGQLCRRQGRGHDARAKGQARFRRRTRTRVERNPVVRIGPQKGQFSRLSRRGKPALRVANPWTHQRLRCAGQLPDCGAVTAIRSVGLYWCESGHDWNRPCQALLSHPLFRGPSAYRRRRCGARSPVRCCRPGAHRARLRSAHPRHVDP